MATNEEDLFQFPSFPGLPFEERRRLTHTALLVLGYTDDMNRRLEEISNRVYRDRPINPLTQTPYLSTYYGPYHTTLEEFLNLPEISCLVYRVNVTNTQTREESFYYRSHFQKFSGKNLGKYHNFRFCIVNALKFAAVQGITNKLGSVCLKDLCRAFNSIKPIYATYGWRLESEGQISFLDGKTLLHALCYFCSRDLVIRVSSTKPATVRLRNHPDFLLRQQIEPERALAEAAINFYSKFHQHYSEKEWILFGPDIYQTPQSRYSSNFLDNVYGAIHHAEGVHDFNTLTIAVQKYTKEFIYAHPDRCIVDDVYLNLLLNMVSPKGLAPLKCWDKEKIDMYMKIVEELTARMSAFDQSFVFDYIELSTQKPEILMTYSLWSLNKIVKHILIVTQSTEFLSGEEIAEAVNFRFKYDVNKWLKNFNLSSIDDLFEKKELQSRVKAICVKTIAGVNYYRNMESIMNDPNLYPGFPFTARKRLLNVLQEARCNALGEDGFVDEKTLNDLYYFCYKGYLDQYEKVKLFGKNYDTVFEFWKEFDCNEFSIRTNDKEEIFYGLTGSFKDAFLSVVEQKTECYDSVKLWMGMRKKDFAKKNAGLQSDFSLKKKIRLDYDMEYLKATQLILSKRRY